MDDEPSDSLNIIPPGCRLSSIFAFAGRNNPGGRTMVLGMTDDRSHLTPFLCLARKQVEIFETTVSEAIQYNIEGRMIYQHQVGIRCKHCSQCPNSTRIKLTSYCKFPQFVHNVYEQVRKFVLNHHMEGCETIPQYIQEKLIQLHRPREILCQDRTKRSK
jgi:hypothetical protein